MGRGLPDGGVPGRDGGPRARRRLPPAAVRRRRRATARWTSRRRARNCWPRVWPSWPTPTTTATGPCSATRCVTPAVRRARARAGPPAGRPREGLGDRHDLHLRRHHRRDVVARAVACPRGPSWGATDACGPCRGATTGWTSDDPDAGGTAPTARSRAAPSPQARTRIVEMLAEAGALVGEPKPIHHPVKFYERGDRPLEIVSSRQWYVRTLATARAPARARPRAALAPPAHAPPLRGVGGGPERGLEHQPPAVLRGPVPGVVPGGRRRVDRPRPSPARRRRPPARRPVERRPRRATARTSGASPAGSSVTPTSWTPGPRPRSPRRSPGAGRTTPTCSPGCSPWTCGPRRTRSSGPGCSAPSCAPSSSIGCLPWTDTAISGWVLDPERKKMSKSRGNVVTPLPLLESHGADGVRYWAASGRPGVDTAVDEGQMKVGRRLAIKVLNASRFALTRLGHESGADPTTAVTAPLDLAMLRRLAEVVVEATAALDALRLRPRPGADRGLLLVVLRRLPRAGQDPRLRGLDAARARPRRAPRWRRPCRCSCASSPPSCPS